MKQSYNEINHCLGSLIQNGFQKLNLGDVLGDFLSFGEFKIDGRIMNANDLYVIFMANHCKNLKTLDISSLKNISDKSLDIFCQKRKDTLKNLIIKNGHERHVMINNESLKVLKNLEKLTICWQSQIETSISEMHHLNYLCLSPRKDSGWYGNTVLRSSYLIELFENKKVKQLESLIIKDNSCGEDEIVTNDVLKCIAFNCPRLKYLQIHDTWKINQKSIGWLIDHLSSLNYLVLNEGRFSVPLRPMENVIKRSNTDFQMVTLTDGYNFDLKINWFVESRTMISQEWNKKKWGPIGPFRRLRLGCEILKNDEYEDNSIIPIVCDCNKCKT